MTWDPELEELKRREALAERLGGPERVERQRAAGRLTIRERIARLVDPDTFHEVGKIAGRATYDEHNDLVDLTPSNFVFGRGRIDRRPVVVGGDDFTVRGGSADATIKDKHNQCERMAHDLRLPLVRLVEARVAAARSRPSRPPDGPTCRPSAAGSTSSITWLSSHGSRSASARWRGWEQPIWPPRTTR